MSKISVIGLLVFCGLFFPLRGQDPDDAIVEAVKVVNVEVPVRVFAAGKPVSDLKKEDFILFEDDQPQSINGFYLSSKKIARPAQAISGEIKAFSSRYFVLVFQVHDFNDALRQGLAYTFEKILRPEDRLLVFVNDFAREYSDLTDREKVRLDIEQNVKDQCHILHNNMLIKLRELDGWVRDLRLQKCIELIRDYKKRFLTQSIDKYYFFSTFLEKISGEKWVISFCQKEMLPRLSPTSDILRNMDNSGLNIPAYISSPTLFVRLVQALQQEMNTGVEFPSEDVAKLFYKVNATFHSLLINTQFETNSPDLEFKSVSGGIEESLRELSKKTGGMAISSTDLKSSLAIMEKKEDSYYMLTYAPRSAKIGKIKVQVVRKGYQLLYDDNQRADYINEYLEKKAGAQSAVKIDGLLLTGKRLSFTLSGYSLAKQKEGIAGFVGVHIRIKNAQNQDVYNESKIYKARSPSFGLYLDYPDLKTGRYDIVVDVIDRVGGKICSDFIKPLVQ